VATVPDLLEAAPGQRITLEVRRARKRHLMLIGIAALALLLGAVAALASTLGTSSTENAGDLPAGTTTQATRTATSTATAEPTTTQAQAHATPSTPKEPSAAERRRQKRAAARRARQKRERAQRAAARRRVTVRLVASQPTFLCVDGDGQRLFNGTLSGARTFRAREVRLNVGLGPTTQVTANGKAVPLTSSPAGLALTPKGQTSLPLGARPCA
jgi:type IV secretory pathway VirB10-like protein